MTHHVPRWLKPATEFGPLAVFFVVYLKFGLFPATGALIGTTALALAVSLWISRRVPWAPLITAVVVGIFGGLTLWFQDETFIKMKPTIVQGLFSVVLLGGLVLGRPLLKLVLGAAWSMDETGWRRLSFRFGLFFAAMAGLNEAVWRTQTTDFWVTFKIFGLLGLTMLFTLAQMPLMTRHKIDESAPDSTTGE